MQKNSSTGEEGIYFKTKVSTSPFNGSTQNINIQFRKHFLSQLTPHEKQLFEKLETFKCSARNLNFIKQTVDFSNV